MPRAEWDSSGRFIRLRLASKDAVEAPKASLIAERLLATAGEKRRLPVLVHIDEPLPPGMDWRYAWMDFVVRNRRELRIAIVREGYSTGGIGRWGALAGVEVREFHQEADAIRWLTEG